MLPASALCTSTLQKQQGDSSAHVDQLSGQIQSLNDTLDELKARLAKVSKQLEDMQSSQQSQAAQTAQVQAQQQAQAQAPPPDVLYNNALRDYNGAKNDLAMQEFSDYIKFYPNTDLAGNCYFYLGEIQFRQGNYQQAAQSYDQVLQNFPSGTKVGFCAAEKRIFVNRTGQTGRRSAGASSPDPALPTSPEALQARERLRKLGVNGAGRPGE